MINFPTTVIDNFFDNPDEIVKMAAADKIEGNPSPNGSFPGLRSQPLHILDEEFWDYFLFKYLHTFWSEEEIKNKGIRFLARSYFSLISNEHSKGWIHCDYPIMHTSIIYLTPNADPKSGTGIYTKKDMYTAELYPDISKKYIKGEMTKEEFEPYAEKHNSGFIEDCYFANKYNRLIGFDSHLWHAIKHSDEKKDRLTIVSFIDDVIAGDFPITRMKKFPLYRKKQGV